MEDSPDWFSHIKKQVEFFSISHCEARPDTYLNVISQIYLHFCREQLQLAPEIQEKIAKQTISGKKLGA